MKSIGLSDDTHKRLKIISANSGKKMYELIVEIVEMLEDIYSQRSEDERE